MANQLPVRRYYPALDGLRGIAIILVVLFHNFGYFAYLNYGWLGVDLFFVLSGFLITEILLDTRNTKNYFRKFYTRRTLRIFPLYYLTLVICILLLPAIKSLPLNLAYYTENQAWFWLYLENWLLIFKPSGDSSALLNHFWSLAVEEQFYLLWPFVILLIKNPRHIIALCITLLVGVVLVRFYIWTHQASFPTYRVLFLFTRIDGILIGAMLALIRMTSPGFLKKNYAFLLLSLALINFAFYFINSDHHFLIPNWAIVGYSSFAVIFALIVNQAIDQKDKVLDFLLNVRLLKFLGKISYGLYIFHWPIYLLFRDSVSDWIRDTMGLEGRSMQVGASIILTLGAFTISVISYYTFEKIWRNLKEKAT